ncbi:hypothetical protein BT96DRAFT_994920 [Gymnopus androsaceus JB14]|uniref:Uncharacterized protein n=1 Tax=Gymnopus androsaceus JB14 TaxID=1447944 RepID=A0A6A4HIR7_9AGAR|nr:hypothetical protein BT96DRAFT_994920 [Gymnopus androsaceus JB14]
MAVRRYVTLFDSLFNLMDVPELEEAFNHNVDAKIPSQEEEDQWRVNEPLPPHESQPIPQYFNPVICLKLKIDSLFKVPLSPGSNTVFALTGSSMRTSLRIREFLHQLPTPRVISARGAMIGILPPFALDELSVCNSSAGVSLWLPLQWAILSYYTHLHSLKDAAPSFIQYQQFQQSPDLDEPDKSFLLVALDLLSGLTQHGVQASHDLWQSQPNLLTLLTICFKHPQAPVRQSTTWTASYMPGIIGLKRGFTQG